MNPLNKMIATFKELSKEGQIPYVCICNEDFIITIHDENDERIQDIKDLFIYDEDLKAMVFNDEGI